VAAGEAIFGPAVATRMLAYFAAPPLTPTPFPELTGREREVLDLLAAGRNNRQIADQLGLSAKTVANHISAIFAKLQVADRTQAILRPRRRPRPPLTHQPAGPDRSNSRRTGGAGMRSGTAVRSCRAEATANEGDRRGPFQQVKPRCSGPGWT
jgi:DNA-binding CsgD family transcriptional regulator